MKPVWRNPHAANRKVVLRGESEIASRCRLVRSRHTWTVRISRLSLRLRTSLHFDAIADSPRKTSFRFDAGVFDKTGFILAFYDNVSLGKSLLDIPAHHPAPDQHVAWAICVQQRRA